MSNEAPEEQADARTAIPATQFVECQFEAPIIDSKQVDAHALASAFWKAHLDAEARGAANETEVFSLLATLCNIILRPADVADPWGGRIVARNGRTPLPSDLSPDQADALCDLLPSVTHPALRARLADIVWTWDRSRRAVGEIAIDSYRACVVGLLDGCYRPAYEHENSSLMDAVFFAQRGLQIDRAVTKKRDRPERMRSALQTLYEATRAAKTAFVAFDHIAQLGLKYDLLDSRTVAVDAEALADAAEPGVYPMAAKVVWDLAAYLYGHVGDADGKRRCEIAAVHQLLQMRKQVSTAGAEASWVMDALQALLHIEGMEELEGELLLDLRRLQRSSLREMGTFRIELGVEDIREKVIERFSSMPLAEALREFAILTRSRPVADLRDEALQTIETSPLMATMAASLIDHKGRTATRVPGANGPDEPAEAWFNQTIDRSEGFRRTQVVAGRIEPARIELSQRFSIGERHFLAIVRRSPFVPQSHESLMALGFARLVQGDYMSAAHLLIPQMEPCLRHVLTIAGEDPTKRFPDATEEDRSIGGLFTHMRPALECILTPDLANEIERLFDMRPGPRLRHELAHGQMADGGCFQPTTIYGCWLMYRVCCLFVLPEWDAVIAPAIAEMA